MNADPVRGLKEILLAKLTVWNGGWGFGSWIEGGRTGRRWTWFTCLEGFRISERVVEYPPPQMKALRNFETSTAAWLLRRLQRDGKRCGNETSPLLYNN